MSNPVCKVVVLFFSIVLGSNTKMCLVKFASVSMEVLPDSESMKLPEDSGVNENSVICILTVSQFSKSYE
jgi:hypothetical protein